MTVTVLPPRCAVWRTIFTRPRDFFGTAGFKSVRAGLLAPCCSPGVDGSLIFCREAKGLGPMGRLTTRRHAFLFFHRCVLLPHAVHAVSLCYPNELAASFTTVNSMWAVVSPSIIQMCLS